MSDTEHQNPLPHEPEFWVALSHSTERSRQLASCFPAFWEDSQRDRDEAERLADRHLRALAGEPEPPTQSKFLDAFRPQSQSTPQPPLAPEVGDYAPSNLPDTDPIYWYHRGHSLSDAAEKTVACFQAKRLRAAQLSPLDPELWQCLDLSEERAYDIVRCMPAYWLEQGRHWGNARETAHYCQNRLKGFIQSAEYDEARCGTVLKTATDGRLNRDDLRNTDPFASSANNFEDSIDQAIALGRVVLDPSWREAAHIRLLAGTLAAKAKLLPDGTTYVRGVHLADQQRLQAEQDFLSLNSGVDDEGPIVAPQWGPLRLLEHVDQIAHFCAVGTSRAGKTTLLTLLAASLVGHRLVVYDNKTDLVSIIRAIRPNDHICILNPFDARSAAWDIAADCKSPANAGELARLFVPDDPRSNIYFIQTLQDLITAAILSLHRTAPGKWQLHHLLAALQADNIRHVLGRYEGTRRVYDTHLNRPHGTPSDVQSSLDARMAPLRPIGAAWMHAEERISIEQYLRTKNTTLVLGHKDRHKRALTPINRILLQLISEGLLDVAGRDDQRTALFLDELEDLGRLDELPSLLNRGPGLGVTVALGFHDVAVLKSLYGEATKGLVSMCGNYAFLRVTNPETARWASDLIGTQEVIVNQLHQGEVGDRSSESITRARVERPAVPPTDIQQLPLTKTDTGLTAYFKSPTLPVYRGTIPGEALFGQMLPSPAADYPDFVPRPDEHFAFPEGTRSLLAEIGFEIPREGEPITTDTTPKPPPFDPDDFPRIEIH
ncbi:type IV secretory system conjugative DNA transfer family protein [Planctomycetota bacterium]